ncbi:MAG: hypothetical protein II704_04270 [Erysipelotrichaceae bacterium]|nr:hypothetical protein [Erysipelotrichaceae bacterium]
MKFKVKHLVLFFVNCYFIALGHRIVSYGLISFFRYRFFQNLFEWPFTTIVNSFLPVVFSALIATAAEVAVFEMMEN